MNSKKSGIEKPMSRLNRMRVADGRQSGIPGEISKLNDPIKFAVEVVNKDEQKIQYYVESGKIAKKLNSLVKQLNTLRAAGATEFSEPLIKNAMFNLGLAQANGELNKIPKVKFGEQEISSLQEVIDNLQIQYSGSKVKSVKANFSGVVFVDENNLAKNIQEPESFHGSQNSVKGGMKETGTQKDKSENLKKEEKNSDSQKVADIINEVLNIIKIKKSKDGNSASPVSRGLIKGSLENTGLNANNFVPVLINGEVCNNLDDVSVILEESFENNTQENILVEAVSRSSEENIKIIANEKNNRKEGNPAQVEINKIKEKLDAAAREVHLNDTDYVDSLIPSDISKIDADTEEKLMQMASQVDSFTLERFVEEIEETKLVPNELDMGNPEIKKHVQVLFEMHKKHIRTYIEKSQEEVGKIISGQREIQSATEELITKKFAEISAASSPDNLSLVATGNNIPDIERFKEELHSLGVEKKVLENRHLDNFFIRKMAEVNNKTTEFFKVRQDELGRLEAENREKLITDINNELAIMLANIDFAKNNLDNMPMLATFAEKKHLQNALREARENYRNRVGQLFRDDYEIINELDQELLVPYKMQPPPTRGRQPSKVVEKTKEYRKKVRESFIRNPVQREFREAVRAAEGQGISKWADQAALYWKSIPQGPKIVATASVAGLSVGTGAGAFLGLGPLLTSTHLASALTFLGLSSTTATGIAAGAGAAGAMGVGGGVLDARAEQAKAGTNRKRGKEAVKHYGKAVVKHGVRSALLGGTVGGLVASLGDWFRTSFSGQRGGMWGWWGSGTSGSSAPGVGFVQDPASVPPQDMFSFVQDPPEGDAGGGGGVVTQTPGAIPWLQQFLEEPISFTGRRGAWGPMVDFLTNIRSESGQIFSGAEANSMVRNLHVYEPLSFLKLLEEKMSEQRIRPSREFLRMKSALEQGGSFSVERLYQFYRTNIGNVSVTGQDIINLLNTGQAGRLNASLLNKIRS